MGFTARSWHTCVGWCEGVETTPLKGISVGSLSQLRRASGVNLKKRGMFLKTQGQPCINGCFNWKISNLYIGNGWKSPFPSILNWLFGVPGLYDDRKWCRKNQLKSGNVVHWFWCVTYHGGTQFRSIICWWITVHVGHTPPKTNCWNPTIIYNGVGGCFSFSNQVFSGSMLVFRVMSYMDFILNSNTL